MVNEDNNSSINVITDEIIENIAIRNIENILNNNNSSITLQSHNNSSGTLHIVLKISNVF